MSIVFYCDRCNETGDRIEVTSTPWILKTGTLLVIPNEDVIAAALGHDDRVPKSINICERCYRDLRRSLKGWFSTLLNDEEVYEHEVGDGAD